MSSSSKTSNKKCYSYMFVMALSIFSLLSKVFSDKQPNESDHDKNAKIITALIWIVVYHFVWSYLCKNKYYTTGWVLALVPVFLSMIVSAYVMGVATGAAECEQEVLAELESLQ